MGFVFRKLILYKDIKDYVVFLYWVSNSFPKSELYGMKSQLTRAATSVLLNFSEGMMSVSGKRRVDSCRLVLILLGKL